MNISIPYNNDIQLVDKINELPIKKNGHNRIIFYFAPSISITGSGRRFPNYQTYIENGDFNSKLFDEDINIFLQKCRKYGFKTCVLFNDILFGMPYNNYDLTNRIPKIQNYLEHLDEQNLTEYVCIANPYLLETINWDRIKNLKVKASVNFQIKSGKTINLLNNLIKNWFPKGKLAEVEIQKDLLRDIERVKRIREELDSSVDLSIIMNEGCLTGCPYQIVHQVHSSTISFKDVIDYNEKFEFGIARCKNITASEPWLFLDANWILPRHLEKYNGIIDSFKLTDRSDSTNMIINKVKAYFLNEYDHENINPLISMMQMEKWHFPEEILPNNFDEVIFAGKTVPDSFYKEIWKNIVTYNKEKYPEIATAINLKKLSKGRLYKFEGVL